MKEGQSVNAGDTLAILEAPDVVAKMEQARAAEAAAQAQNEKAIKGAREEQIQAAYEMWQKAQAGVTIAEKSYKNDRYRNEKVCKMLTARYRLHFAEGKEHVNFMRLRHHDKVKYFIYHALKREVPNARSWSELRLALRKYGIDTQWKLSRTTGEMQGVKFTCDQLTFSGSKIDRQFSFLNIDQELRYNALSATVSQCQAQAETIREEPRPEYQQENHSGISLGLFTPSPTDYDTEEAIQANWLKKKKKKPKRKRGFFFIF